MQFSHKNKYNNKVHVPQVRIQIPKYLMEGNLMGHLISTCLLKSLPAGKSLLRNGVSYNNYL